MIDGEFEEWEGVSSQIIDPEGDAGESLDFLRLSALVKSDAVFFHFELSQETIWQNGPEETAGNGIRMQIDLDNRLDTGRGEEGIDLEVRLGEREVRFYRHGEIQKLGFNEIGMTAAPTHSGTHFEFRIPFLRRPGFAQDFSLQPSPGMGIRLIDSQGRDRIPDEGFLKVSRDPEPFPPPGATSLDRWDPRDIRILSHNVLYTSVSHTPGPFQRYLRALQPDVINFQEIWQWTAGEVRQFVDETLPLPEGHRWQAVQVDDCVTVSRLPIRHRAAVGGNLVCTLALPEIVETGEMVLFNAHTPCCDNDRARDWEHDHMAATWRDLMNGEGLFPVESDSPVILVGDFNMVGLGRQLRSLRDGDIFDNGVFGPDFRPARRMGSLRSVPLRHTHFPRFYTWRADAAPFSPGKLDFIFFSPDAASLQNNFTLDTSSLPQEVLSETGLLREDSAVSDHLVLVADFRFP